MRRTLAVWISAAAFVGACDARAADPVQPAGQSETAGISSARYITAGLVGTFMGYGIGHAIAQEWSSFGWVCTVGEITPLLVGAATGTFQRLNNGDAQDNAVPIGLLVSYGVFRVVELVDIWTRPTVRSDSAARPPLQGAWAALPVPNRHGANVLLVGSF